MQRQAKLIQAEESAAKRERQEKVLADRFARSVRAAQLHHAKLLGLEHGRAQAQGLTVEQHRQQQAALAQQQMQMQAQAAQQGQGGQQGQAR
jgi:hypothetical protein